MKRSRSSFQGQLERERAETIRALQEATKKLQRIENALARLRDGSFGRCLACKRTISAERLDVLPYAEWCLECQVRHEGSQ